MEVVWNIIAGIILIGILVLPFYIIYRIYKKSRLKSAQRTEQKEVKVKLIDTNRALIGDNKLIFSGKYLMGHPNILLPIDVTNIYFEDNNINIVNTKDLSKIGTIPLKDVLKVDVNDNTTIDKRISQMTNWGGGLSTVRTKTDINILYYLTIVWQDGKFEQNTIFEFHLEPKKADKKDLLLTDINTLKSEILTNANKV